MTLDASHSPAPADGAEPADEPGREGSATSLAVLRALHPAGSEGLLFAGVCSAVQAPPDAVRAALTGLRRRNRVACIGTSFAARWVCARFAAQARAELETRRNQ